MWPHFLNLLSRSWQRFLAGQGTTGLGFVSPYTVPVISAVCAGALLLLVRGKAAMIAHWRQNLGIVALAAAVANLLWYGPLIGRALVQVVYDDHASLVEQNQTLETQVHMVTAELQKLELENSDLKQKVPAETSLKSRALQTADDLDRFFAKRSKNEPSCVQTSSMTAEEQRAIIQPCAKYNLETQNEYAKFAPTIMSMVQEFKAKGISVQDIENCAPLGFCGIPISTQLRAFAARLDAKDNVKR
jgi:hypothetical protein